MPIHGKRAPPPAQRAAERKAPGAGRPARDGSFLEVSGLERVKLYCGGQCRGEVTICPEGVRTRVRAVMTDPGDGLYRAALVGGQGELALGVLEPGDGGLSVCRRLYSREVAGVGRPLRGEARCSFRFQEARWQETGCPAQFFRGAFWTERLRPIGRCWWRRERGALYLAFPLEADGPFPLETLFCFARVERVEGRACAVYAFREEKPVLP